MGIARLHNEKAIYFRADGTPVDTEGKVIADVLGSDGEVLLAAPKPPENTDPRLQPGALGGATPEQRIGAAIAEAIRGPVVPVVAAPVADAPEEAKAEEPKGKGKGKA